MGARTAKEVDKALRDLVLRLKKAYKIDRILLYGSRSRGNNLKSSDVDLVVVSSDFEGVDWRERVISVARMWKGPVRLESLCYTPKEFRKMAKQITIVRKAKREGLRLA